jgi:hypothetical protein
MYGKTNINASPPVGGSGYEKPQSAFGLCAVFLRHILSALQMLRICLFGRPKRRKQPERYAKWALKLVGIFYKNILTKMV